MIYPHCLLSNHHYFSSLSFCMCEAIYSLPFHLLLSKCILGLLEKVKNRQGRILLGKMQGCIPDSSFSFLSDRVMHNFNTNSWSLWTNTVKTCKGGQNKRAANPGLSKLLNMALWDNSSVRYTDIQGTTVQQEQACISVCSEYQPGNLHPAWL